MLEGWFLLAFRIDSIFAIAKATPTQVRTVTSILTTPSVGWLPKPEKIVPTTTLDLCIKILVSVLIMLIPLGIGLYSRRRLVRSSQEECAGSLDN